MKSIVQYKSKILFTLLCSFLLITTAYAYPLEGGQIPPGHSLTIKIDPQKLPPFVREAIVFCYIHPSPHGQWFEKENIGELNVDAKGYPYNAGFYLDKQRYNYSTTAQLSNRVAYYLFQGKLENKGNPEIVFINRTTDKKTTFSIESCEVQP